MKLAILPCLGPDRCVCPRQRWADPDRSVHTGPWQRCAVPDRGVQIQMEVYRSLTEACSARRRCTGLWQRCTDSEVYRSQTECTDPDRGVWVQDGSVQVQTEMCGSKMEVYRSYREVYRSYREVYRSQTDWGVQVPDRLRCTGPRQTEVYRSRQSWRILIFCHGVLVTLPCLADCFAM